VKGCNKKGNVFKEPGAGDKKFRRALKVAAPAAGDAFTGQARVGYRAKRHVAKPAPSQVLGRANWTTIDGVNYARTDAP